MEAGPKDGNVKCYICDKEVLVKKMRDHTARHLLTAQLGLPEEGKSLITVGCSFWLATSQRNANGSLRICQIGSHPCGFCGRSGTCSVGLKKGAKKTMAPDSDCPYYYKFSLASAAKSTISGPSTNRPIVCTLCRRATAASARQAQNDNSHVQWSYNIAAHVAQRHPNASQDQDLIDLEAACVPSLDERIRLGVEKGKAVAGKRKRGEAADLPHAGAGAVSDVAGASKKARKKQV